MKKVGIITLYGDNYGNKLQNLAVQKILEENGCQAETILVNVYRGIKKPERIKDFIKKFSPCYLIEVCKSRFRNKFLYKKSKL